MSASYFKDILIGSIFTNGGAAYTKCSSRTARLTENNRVFYFGAEELAYQC